MNSKRELVKLVKLADSGVDKEIKEIGFKSPKDFYDKTGIHVNEIYGAWIPRDASPKNIKEILGKEYVEEIISPVFILVHNMVYLRAIPGYVKGKIAYVNGDKLF